MSPDSNAMQTLLQNWATYFKDVSAVILHLDPVCFLELQPAALRTSCLAAGGGSSARTSAVKRSTDSQSVFTITEKAPTRP